jgi:L-cysteine:1D-myo-inositol 2-amino-2-deoxy-alpha-D-glucopyranoside ligase
VLARVRERLSDDLDTAGALTAVDRWTDEALTRGGDDASAPTLIRDTLDALLGIRL